jgi:hypothetical protein
MSIWVILLYGAILGVVLFFLYHFGPQAWYWHALSVAAALGLGLMPPPQRWQGAAFDVLMGSGFLLLFAWGVGGFVLYGNRRTRHRHA